MLPSFAADQVPHTLARYAVCIGQRLVAYATGGVACSDREDLARRELGGAGSFATSRAALLRRILHVVERCAEEQMIRATARRVIAFVQHVQAWWDWSEVDLPRDAMGENYRLRLAATHPPVSIWVSVRGPFPATLSAADVLRPALAQRFATPALPVPVATATAEPIRVACVLRGDDQRRGAIFAEPRATIEGHRSTPFGAMPSVIPVTRGLPRTHSISVGAHKNG